jgi:hypothetical protein
MFAVRAPHGLCIRVYVCLLPPAGRPGAGGRKGGKAKPSKAEALKAAEDKQARIADAAARQDKVRS